MTSTFTTRQQNEAAVYNERAATIGPTLTDEDLAVTPDHPPYPNREHIEFLDHLFDRLGDPRGKRIIEVGCGSGYLTTYLAHHGARAVGVDVSAGMLDLARRRARVNGVEDNTEFFDAAIETLGEPDGSFDAVIANQVLHHLEIEPAMANISRLLKPGGVALFAEPVFMLPESVRQLRYSRPVLRFFPSAADTPDERPLNASTLAVVTGAFDHNEQRSFQLSTRVQNFRHLSDGTFRRLETLDRRLLRVPGADRMARDMTLVLWNDRKPTHQDKGIGT